MMMMPFLDNGVVVHADVCSIFACFLGAGICMTNSFESLHLILLSLVVLYDNEGCFN
jgi:hypothetical protein